MRATLEKREGEREKSEKTEMREEESGDRREREGVLLRSVVAGRL